MDSEEYRVEITKDGFRLSSLTYVDRDLEGFYTLFSNLPKWVQERLAVLAILKDNIVVDKVGRKISDNIYWVKR